MAFQNLIVSNLVKTSSSTSNIWGFIHPLHKIWKCAQRNLKKKLRKILVPGRKIVFLQLYIWGWVHLTTDCSIVSIYSLYSFGSIECGENFIIILYSPTQIIFSNFTSGVEFTHSTKSWKVLREEEKFWFPEEKSCFSNFIHLGLSSPGCWSFHPRQCQTPWRPPWIAIISVFVVIFIFHYDPKSSNLCQVRGAALYWINIL